MAVAFKTCALSIAAVVAFACASCDGAPPPEDAPVDLELPEGFAKAALDLLAPYTRDQALPGGWRIRGVSVAGDTARYRFAREGATLEVVLGQPGPSSAARTRNFGLRLADADRSLDAAENATLVEALRAALEVGDTGAPPWVAVSRVDPRAASRPWNPGAALVRAGVVPTSWPTFFCELELLLACLLVASRARELGRVAASSLPRSDAAWLLAWMILGAVLRTAWGIRVPGYINGHGYEQVFQLCASSPPGYDYHGNGSYALFGLLFLVMPRTELTIVGTSVVLSLLTVPGIYALARAGSGDRTAARWAAAATAILPAFVFYAATEERYIPGIFFLVATLVLLGVAARTGDRVLTLAAALLAAVTVQFQPFLFLLPIPALLLLAGTREGRSLVRRPFFWAALVIFVVATAGTAYQHVTHLVSGQKPAGDMTLGVNTLVSLTTIAPDSDATGGNAVLDPRYSPPPFAILAVLGIVAWLSRRGSRWWGASVAASYLLMTLPGLGVGPRMNMVRLELPGLPFFVLAVGGGVAALDRWLERWTFRVPGLRAALGCAVLLGTVWAWPGPIPTLYTPQRERRFIADNVSRIPEGCTILVPSTPRRVVRQLPIYLSEEAGMGHSWRRAINPAEASGPPGACVVYYRPVDCYDLESWAPAPSEPGAGGLRAECVGFERGLTLEPVVTAAIPALPDCGQDFRTSPLEIGFFRVLSVQPVGEPEGR